MERQLQSALTDSAFQAVLVETPQDGNREIGCNLIRGFELHLRAEGFSRGNPHLELHANTLQSEALLISLISSYVYLSAAKIGYFSPFPACQALRPALFIQ